MSKNEVTILDVAKFILESKVSMTTMKLQKLCYYVHAWYLVANSEPIFEQKFQAWANGPVSPALYEAHRQKYSINVAEFSQGNSSCLVADQKSFISAVLDVYSPLTASQLSLLTHSENPWIETRAGLPEGALSNNEIDNKMIHDFYKALNKRQSLDVRDINWPSWVAPSTK